MAGQGARPRGRRAPSAEDLRFYRALGRAIKALRAQRGLDRKSLAALAEVSYPYLSEIENGKKRPSARALLAIAQALGVRPYELLEGTETIALSMEPEGLAVGPPPGSVRGAPVEAAYDQLAEEPPGAALPGEPMTPPSRRASWMRRARTPATASSDVPPFKPVGVFIQERPAAPALARSALLKELLALAANLSDEDIERLIDLAHRLGNS